MCEEHACHSSSRSKEKHGDAATKGKPMTNDPHLSVVGTGVVFFRVPEIMKTHSRNDVLIVLPTTSVIGTRYTAACTIVEPLAAVAYSLKVTMLSIYDLVGCWLLLLSTKISTLNTTRQWK